VWEQLTEGLAWLGDAKSSTDDPLPASSSIAGKGPVWDWIDHGCASRGLRHRGDLAVPRHDHEAAPAALRAAAPGRRRPQRTRTANHATPTWPASERTYGSARRPPPASPPNTIRPPAAAPAEQPLPCLLGLPPPRPQLDRALGEPARPDSPLPLLLPLVQYVRYSSNQPQRKARRR
jgi:hypothetical protein